MANKLIVRDGVGGSAGETGVINAAAEVLEVDVEDLDNIVVHAIQTTDAGTVTAVIEHSLNGTTGWSPLGAALSEASWAAANDAVVERTISDSNGMSIRTKRIRLRASALAAGGVYALRVAGTQRKDFA